MKALIVEDEIHLGRALRQGLKENGCAAELVGDGEAGLEMVLGGHFDVVVLDVMLPKLDGFEVLAEIRKAGNNVPVVMLTARGQVGDRVKGLDLGADDYLSKPFEFQELLARIRAVTRRPPTMPQCCLVVADLKMNLQTREVRRAGKLIELTHREQCLLEYLMRRKGLVLTRGMILDHVWNSDCSYNGGSNLVEVYINFLRKKIDRGFPTKLITTIRGTGYVIQDKLCSD